MTPGPSAEDLRGPALRGLAAAAVLLCASCAHVGPRLDLDETVETPAGTFEVRYSTGDEAGAASVRRAIERAAPRLSRFGVLTRTVEVAVVPDHAGLERAVGRFGYEWLKAWARFDDVVVQSPSSWSLVGASQAQVDELLLHELTHCVMYQASSSEAEWGRKRIPLWFREGMASVVADQGYRRLGLADVARAMALDSRDPLLDAERLYRSEAEVVYSAAHHAFVFLTARYGDEAVRGILATMREGPTFEPAFERAVGVRRGVFEAEFRRYLAMEGFRPRQR